MPARYQETYIKPLPGYAEVDEGPNYQTAQVSKQNLDMAITCAKQEAQKGPFPNWWMVEELTYNKQKGWVKTGREWRSKAAQKEITNKQKRLPGI